MKLRSALAAGVVIGALAAPGIASADAVEPGFESAICDTSVVEIVAPVPVYAHTSTRSPIIGVALPGDEFGCEAVEGGGEHHWCSAPGQVPSPSWVVLSEGHGYVPSRCAIDVYEN
jgi:hypothetical protein